MEASGQTYFGDDVPDKDRDRYKDAEEGLRVAREEKAARAARERERSQYVYSATAEDLDKARIRAIDEKIAELEEERRLLVGKLT